MAAQFSLASSPCRHKHCVCTRFYQKIRFALVSEKKAVITARFR